MKTIPLTLDDELDAMLDSICAEQGRNKAEVATEVVRKYVEAGQLRRALQDSTLVALYQELAEEDINLAEEGMAEYQRTLEESDQL